MPEEVKQYRFPLKIGRNTDIGNSLRRCATVTELLDDVLVWLLRVASAFRNGIIEHKCTCRSDGYKLALQISQRIVAFGYCKWDNCLRFRLQVIFNLISLGGSRNKSKFIFIRKDFFIRASRIGYRIMIILIQSHLHRSCGCKHCFFCI